MRKVTAILPLLLLLLLLLLLCGCKTKYIATEVHTTDTLSIRDTMTITDTLYLERIVSVNAERMDSNTTDEFKAATIKITHFDSVGRVAKVTDIDLTSEKKSKSGGKLSTSANERQIEQTGHKEESSHKKQSGSKTDIKTKEIRVPYVPWWVTAAGIAMILAVIFFLTVFLKRLVNKNNNTVIRQ